MEVKLNIPNKLANFNLVFDQYFQAFIKERSNNFVS